MKRVVLHKGKDRPIRNRHHWIFSGAVRDLPRFENGEILPVYDFHTQILGHAYFNRHSQIIGRMLNFDKSDPLQAVRDNIKSAFLMRNNLVNDLVTDCYRLISGEADNLPGLVVDKYHNVLVIQISTLGMDKLKDLVVKELLQILPETVAIYERSDIGSRHHEGMNEFMGLIYGKLPKQIIATENTHKFEVDVESGHKTGFYLDQREMRKLIGELADGNKKLLNCFSYSGGFSVYAAAAGALTTSVDISTPAIEACQRNFIINDLDPKKHEFVDRDVFDYLNDQKELDYDVIILDPPAFAKKKSDIGRATNGYRSLNQLAITKAKPNSILLTCSCSYHVNAEMFTNIVTQAASKAGRKVRIIGKHILSPDHAINIFNSEQDYLKSLLLYIE